MERVEERLGRQRRVGVPSIYQNDDVTTTTIRVKKHKIFNNACNKN